MAHGPGTFSWPQLLPSLSPGRGRTERPHANSAWEADFNGAREIKTTQNWRGILQLLHTCMDLLLLSDKPQRKKLWVFERFCNQHPQLLMIHPNLLRDLLVQYTQWSMDVLFPNLGCFPWNYDPINHYIYIYIIIMPRFNTICFALSLHTQ